MFLYCTCLVVEFLYCTCLVVEFLYCLVVFLADDETGPAEVDMGCPAVDIPARGDITRQYASEDERLVDMECPQELSTSMSSLKQSLDSGAAVTLFEVGVHFQVLLHP